MASAVVFHDLHVLTEAAATRFGLPWPIVLKPLLASRRCKIDGKTRWRQATIFLRVHRYHRPRQPLARSTIFATLAHELAHLAPKCWEHGPAHRDKTVEIAAWIREQGFPVDVKLHKGTFTRKKRRTSQCR